MMKKIAALIGAGALLLSVAGPAFANGWWWGGSKDVAIVDNAAVATANTGGNGQGNGAEGGVFGGNVSASGNNSMVTGNANAYAGALVVANTHVGCGPCASGGLRHKDVAVVGNIALADADTGSNGQGNGAEGGFIGGNVSASGNNSMVTGSTGSTARAWTVVNTHVGF